MARWKPAGAVVMALLTMLAASTVWPHVSTRIQRRTHTSTFHWLVPPLVRVCHRSDVSVERVRAAVRFWEARGARFRAVVSAECAFSADGTPLDRAGSAAAFNTITIVRLGQLTPEGKAGSSHWAVKGEVPLWAVVSLPPGEIEPLIVEHELGHALGYPHVSVRHHLMNPLAADLGESTEGLELSAR